MTFKKPLEIFPDGQTTTCVIEGGKSLLISEGVWNRYFLPPAKYYSIEKVTVCVFSAGIVRLLGIRALISSDHSISSNTCLAQ